MKKNILNILACAAIATMSFSSCEKELQVFNDQTSCLNFFYGDDVETSELKEEETKTSYSFVYAGSTVTIDTIWFNLRTQGFVYDYARPYEVEQVMVEGANNAVAGKHYVAFTESSNASLYQIPANTSRGKMPIIVLRDASLADGDVVLQVRIKPNDYFQSGYKAFQTRTLTISASLSQPDNWTYDYPLNVAYSLGDWGPVKHQWLIDHTGEKWDADYIEELFNGDSAYLDYIIAKLTIVLAEENEERAAQGLDPICEEDGTPVYFGY